MALDATGSQLAVAGRRGFALCTLASLSWRLFGDVAQVREVDFLRFLLTFPRGLSSVWHALRDAPGAESRLVVPRRMS